MNLVRPRRNSPYRIVALVITTLAFAAYLVWSALNPPKKHAAAEIHVRLTAYASL